MEGINILIENLVKEDNEKYCKEIFGKFENAGYILNCYEKESVSEETLLNLLNKSVKNKQIRWLIPDILFFIYACDITDRVFEKCLNYPGRFRKTLLSQLGHLCLKKEQLEQLNTVLETPEAFYKLFLMYLQDDSFSTIQIRALLQKNERHLGALLNYKEHFDNQKVRQDKITEVDKLIQKSLTDS